MDRVKFVEESLKNFTWPILEYFVPYNGQPKLNMSLND